MEFSSICLNADSTENILDNIGNGKLNTELFSQDTSIKYKDLRRFGETFSKWVYDQIYNIVSLNAKDKSKIMSHPKCAYVERIEIGNMARILGRLINNQVISLGTSITILHKLLLFKPRVGCSSEQQVAGPCISDEAIIMRTERELLFFIRTLTDIIVPVLKCFGARIAYIIANSHTFRLANPEGAANLLTWSKKHLQSRSFLDTDPISNAEVSPCASDDSPLISLKFSSTIQLRDQDDEVIAHALANPMFVRQFDFDFDNRLEYRHPIEASIFTEREKASDQLIELIRQYQEVVRNDLSGAGILDFWSKLRSVAYARVLDVNDLSLSWLADLFTKLMIFHGLRVVASTSTMPLIRRHNSGTLPQISSSPSTGENTPRSTPVQQLGALWGNGASQTAQMLFQTQQTLPGTPPRGTTPFESATNTNAISSGKTVSTCGSASSTPVSFSFASAVAGNLVSQTATHLPYDKHRKLEQRMGLSANSSTLSSSTTGGAFSSSGNSFETNNSLTVESKESKVSVLVPRRQQKQYGSTSQQSKQSVTAVRSVSSSIKSLSSSSKAGSKRTSVVNISKTSASERSTFGASENGTSFVSTGKPNAIKSAKTPSSAGSNGRSASGSSGSIPPPNKADVDSTTMKDPYLQPGLNFQGNLQFFYRFIVLVDSYKFSKCVEFSVVSELVVLMKMVVEGTQKQGTSKLNESGTSKSVYRTDFIGDGNSRERSQSVVEDSERDRSSSSRSGSSGCLDEDSNLFSSHFRSIDHAMSPPLLYRDASTEASNKSGQVGQNSLSLQIMSLKLLGKFLGLLHFYAQWTLLSTVSTGGTPNLPIDTLRAPNNLPQVSTSSPVLRLAEQFESKRNMFYNVTLEMGEGSASRTGGGLPIYGWLIESKKKRCLISTVPWIVEFLRMAKYDSVIYSANTRDSSASRQLNAPLNLYENVIEELLSIESAFVQRISGSSDNLSTTETYILMEIQEIYQICPAVYLRTVKERVGLVGHNRTPFNSHKSPRHSPVKMHISSQLYDLAKSSLSHAKSGIADESNALLGTTGFIRHVTPHLYDFVSALQRSIVSRNTKLATIKEETALISEVSSVWDGNHNSGDTKGCTSTPTLEENILSGSDSGCASRNTPVVSPVTASVDIHAVENGTENDDQATRLTSAQDPLCSPISNKFVNSFAETSPAPLPKATYSIFQGKSNAIGSSLCDTSLSDSVSLSNSLGPVENSSSVECSAYAASDNEKKTASGTKRRTLEMLRTAFFTQHPAIERLRVFVVDHVLQLGMIHMREYVAWGVRVLWTKCSEVKLRDTNELSSAVGVKEMHILHQQNVDQYEVAVLEEVTAVKMMCDSQVNGFLDKFVNVDAVAAVVSLCGMYSTSPTDRIFKYQELQAAIQISASSFEKSAESKVSKLAIQLITTEMQHGVRAELFSFFSSYLSKKLTEVAHMSIQQYKKASKPGGHKTKGRDLVAAVASLGKLQISNMKPVPIPTKSSMHGALQLLNDKVADMFLSIFGSGSFSNGMNILNEGCVSHCGFWNSTFNYADLKISESIDDLFSMIFDVTRNDVSAVNKSRSKNLLLKHLQTFETIIQLVAQYWQESSVFEQLTAKSNEVLASPERSIVENGVVNSVWVNKCHHRGFHSADCKQVSIPETCDDVVSSSPVDSLLSLSIEHWYIFVVNIRTCVLFFCEALYDSSVSMMNEGTMAPLSTLEGKQKLLQQAIAGQYYIEIYRMFSLLFPSLVCLDSINWYYYGSGAADPTNCLIAFPSDMMMELSCLGFGYKKPSNASLCMITQGQILRTYRICTKTYAIDYHANCKGFKLMRASDVSKGIQQWNELHGDAISTSNIPRFIPVMQYHMLMLHQMVRYLLHSSDNCLFLRGLGDIESELCSKSVTTERESDVRDDKAVSKSESPFVSFYKLGIVHVGDALVSGYFLENLRRMKGLVERYSSISMSSNCEDCDSGVSKELCAMMVAVIVELLIVYDK